MANKSLFQLKAEAVIENIDRGTHFLKVRGGFGGEERIVWIPFSALEGERTFKDFVADKFGYLIGEKDHTLVDLKHAISSLPRIIGTSRLGWSPTRDAFLYDGKVYTVTEHPERRYEFLAPEGTLIKRAEDALTPHGDRNEQYRQFRRQWDRSFEFCLALSLGTISPFLEALNAPSLPFHLAGASGLGKTTVLRLAVSAYADPDSPLTKIDFSKDTQNYADAQLGILHNFPLLLDETTLRSPEELADAAYSIAVGRTKGRLTGPEQLYLPAEPLSYTVVCFLSGESSIQEQIQQRGAGARFVEIMMEQPIFEKSELPRLWEFAKIHYGWYGRDLIEQVIKHHFAGGKDGEKLSQIYGTCRAKAARWCQDHPRVLEFLAAVQVGYYLAAKLLLHQFKYMPDDQHDALIDQAERFARETYQRINKSTLLDQVVHAIRELPEIDEWVSKGFVPIRLCDSISREFGLAERGALGKFLRNQGLVKRVEPRKDTNGSSVRCYILTPEGEERLSA